jgi:Velvet factor
MNFNDPGTTSVLIPNTNVLNTKSPASLASTFSDVFEVFSVSTYPGQIQTTDLNECFASQGVKIMANKKHGDEED